MVTGGNVGSMVRKTFCIHEKYFMGLNYSIYITNNTLGRLQFQTYFEPLLTQMVLHENNTGLCQSARRVVSAHNFRILCFQ